MPRSARASPTQLVVAVAVVASSVFAFFGCASTGGQEQTGGAPGQVDRRAAAAGRDEVAGVALAPVPDSVLKVCLAAQERLSYEVLCPPRLPRGTEARDPWRLPEPLQATTSRDAALVVGYGAEDPKSLAGNHPRRHLHLIVSKATLGVPEGAQRATLGGKEGWYAPAATEYFEGIYFGNHARFVWRERGTLYFASLHGFNPLRTRRLLGTIMRELRPARELATLRAPVEPDTVGVGPTDLAVTSGAIWATSRAGIQGGRARLYRIDPASQQTELVSQVGARSPSVAGNGAGLWTAMPIEERDPSTGQLRSRTPVGSGRLVTALASLDDGVVATMVRWRPGEGQVSEVWRIGGGGRVRWRARAGRGASDLALLDGSAWVVNARSGTVSRLSLKDGETLGTLRLGGRPFAVAATRGAIWVTDPTRHLVHRVDPASNRVVARVQVGNSPRGVVATPQAVWVAEMGEGNITEIDPGANQVRRRVHVGGDPIAVALDRGTIWVALYSDGAVKALPAS